MDQKKYTSQLLTESDRNTVKKFAEGHDCAREAAIHIFYHFLNQITDAKQNIDREDWPIEMKFMSEVDSPCPDYILKSMYRKQLVDKSPGSIGSKGTRHDNNMLYSDEKDIKKLRDRMVGATVTKVESPLLDEAICRFHLKKKGKTYSFVLYATELGFWVKDDLQRKLQKKGNRHDLDRETDEHAR